MLGPQSLLRILVLLMFAACLATFACSSGGNDDDDDIVNDDDIDDDDTSSPPPGDAIEGDMGIRYVPGTECFAWDAEPREGEDIWVAPGGSDSNSGTAEDEPLQTLPAALCHAAPGQTIHIMPGTYVDTVIMALFGDDSAPITIRGEMDGDQRPVLDGQKHLTMGIGFLGDITEGPAKNVIIENLEFRNYTDQGILVSETENATIRNCKFDGNGFHSISEDSDGEGFSILATNSSQINILDNEAMNSGPEPALLERGLLGTALDTWGVSDSLIEGNYCHDNIGCCILVEEGKRVTVRNNEIADSVLYSDYLDGGIWLDGGYDVTVTGNYIHDNGGVAIQVSDSELQYPYASCRYSVTGNRIESNWWALYTYNMYQCPLPEEKYLVWEDNEVSGNAYPGDVQEYIDGTDGQILCHLWPCGENQTCVDPENTHGEPVCE